MTRRIDAGAAVAAVGAILLLVSLFLDWYGDDRKGASAWQVFEVIDLALATIALLAVSTFISRGFEPRLPQAPLLLLGCAALVLVVSQLIDRPPTVAGFDEVDTLTGAWLALAASCVMLAGAFLSVARVSFTVEHRPPPPPAADPETETVKLRPPDEPA